MDSLNINNIYESISKAEMNPLVGIRIAFLTGDDSLSFYVAEIGPHKKVGSHYHISGIEIYQILEGSGEIHLGNPLINDSVNWTVSKKVKMGDCFTVAEKEVHQLINTEDTKLLILFACPKSHLAENRLMTASFSN